MRYNFLPRMSYVDNTQLNPGTGGDLIRSTDVGGVKTQHAKIAFGGAGVAGPVDFSNPLPVINPAEGVTSLVNSTVVNLAANAVFTGPAEDVSLFANIKINAYSSHASAANGLAYQFSHDGIFWPPATDVYTIPAVTQKNFSIGVNMKWYRLVYTNGATTTTTIVIQSLYHKSDKQPSSVRPQDGRSNDNDFVEVLSALLGYNSLADAWNRVGITNAIAGGNENLLDRLKVNAALRMIDSAQPSGSKLVNVTGSQALGLDVNTGTDITTPTAMPAGGLGMRGWLSAIWTKINGSLAVTGTFFQATQPVSLATNTPDVIDRAARVLGVVTPPAITKGTQGAVGFTTQDLKDAGRNQVHYYMAVPILSPAAEALQSLTVTKGGVTVVAATTPAVVTAGKILRITRVAATYIATATSGYGVVKLRFNTAGLVAVASPIAAVLVVGAGAPTTANSTAAEEASVSEGWEFAAGTGIGVTTQGFAAVTGTLVGYLLVSVTGYEY